ncbi:hypothetical protein HDU77_006629, partial [Chytriomyces hyalinus]
MDDTLNLSSTSTSQFILLCHYETSRPPTKFSKIKFKTLKIVTRKTPSCKLDIPLTWDIHPVFYPEKLKLYYFNNSKHRLDSQPMKLCIIDLDNKQQALVSWKDHHP